MYCTLEDLKQQSSDDFLIRCTDDAGTGTIVEAIVTEKIEDADAEIDSYCRSQYAVPFSIVPGLIRKLSVDIALYNLVSRRGMDEESPDVILLKRYQAAIKLLENLAKGLVTIEPTAAGEAAPQPQQTSIKSSPRRFSRGSMEGY